MSQEIPRINTYVYMMSDTGNTMGYGKLCVYLDSMSIENKGFFSHFDILPDNPPDFVEGDIFWKVYGTEVDIENNVLWGKCEDFPYWITEEDLVQFIVENNEMEFEEKVEEKVEKIERSQILDIRE
jgi:hypothetical protein